MQILTRFFVILGLIGLFIWSFFQFMQPQNRESAYQSEFYEVLNQYRRTAATDPKYAYYKYRLASLSMDFISLAEAKNLMEKWPNDRELLFLRAKIALTMHDPNQAKELYQQLKTAFFDPRLNELDLDIHLQQGDYEYALTLLEQQLQHNPSWTDMAIVAHLLHKFGDSKAADTLYGFAQDKLSSKQLKEYAWLELQRGIIYLENKNYSQALEHFKTADNIYPKYWLIQEHLAETYALLGDVIFAKNLYEKVITTSYDPIYALRLASLIKTEDPPRYLTLINNAEDQFQNRYQLFPYAAAGHIMDVWLEETNDDTKLKRLDELSSINLANRPNPDALILRIKVLLLLNQQAQAMDLARQLVASPWRSPDVYSIAKTFNLEVPQHPLHKKANALYQQIIHQ
jgi:Tfp pilus assembly protein PilF